MMTTQNDLQENWKNVVSEFQNKTDRATAVLGTAFLDAHLGRLIASFFIEERGAAEPLLDVERPLGTFSARATYCMGLISANESNSPRQLFVFSTAMLTQHLAWWSIETERKRCISPDELMLVDLDE